MRMAENFRENNRIRLADSRSPCPLRRATNAETATFRLKNGINVMNFGCPHSPTAAMAYAPSPLTITVSMKETSETRNCSTMAGQATRIVRERRRPIGGMGPRSGIEPSMDFLENSRLINIRGSLLEDTRFPCGYPYQTGG